MESGEKEANSDTRTESASSGTGSLQYPESMSPGESSASVDIGAAKTPGMSTKKSKRGRRSLQPATAPPDQLLLTAGEQAKMYMKNLQVDLAVREFVRCVALARLAYGDSHWRLAAAHGELGSAYLKLKEYADQAEQHSLIAREILLNSRAMQQCTEQDKCEVIAALINVYLTLGVAQVALTRLSEAEPNLLNAEKLATDIAKLPDVNGEQADTFAADTACALARLHVRQAKYEHATRYFIEAMEIMKEHTEGSGKDNEEWKKKLVNLHVELAQCQLNKSTAADCDRAVKNLYKAHELALSLYGDNAIEVAEVAHQMALAYTRTIGYDAEVLAEQWYGEALAIYETEMGGGSEKSLLIQDSLVKLYVRTNRHEEAQGLLKRTLAAKKAVFGDYSETVAEAYKLMGSIFLAQGQLRNALTLLQKCLQIEKLVFGNNHRKVISTHNTIQLIEKSPATAAKRPVKR
ncbi:PREDICTED: tetratricopeptide repeat protein 23-like [Priapulus caudatus]|uniref:Tetratricopeptide repeat protein 23-like n=1 Tax=Priapulus caudatus TaxID=37621 RepID=A0ABM1EDD4_PRICU|nr:PREDICTED: tetratricopeptide repeat protein 23-like [Priapulus caudatus]